MDGMGLILLENWRNNYKHIPEMVIFGFNQQAVSRIFLELGRNISRKSTLRHVPSYTPCMVNLPTWLNFIVNVGKYSIHDASGCCIVDILPST